MPHTESDASTPEDNDAELDEELMHIDAETLAGGSQIARSSLSGEAGGSQIASSSLSGDAPSTSRSSTSMALVSGDESLMGDLETPQRKCKKRAPAQDATEMLCQYLANRKPPTPLDFLPSKPAPKDSIDTFLESIGATLRTFPPVSIAEMKLKIAQLVGEEEIALARRNAATQFVYISQPGDGTGLNNQLITLDENNTNQLMTLDENNTTQLIELTENHSSIATSTPLDKIPLDG